MKTQKPNLQTQHDFRVAIAFLEGCKDRRPVNYDLKWQGVINLLAQPEEREEKDGPAFVPAEFGVREYTSKENTTYEAVLRYAKAVERISMGVCDYDHGVTPREAAWHWRSYEHVLCTTHSHRGGNPRFRVVLPLAEPVPAEYWNSAWLHFRDLGKIGSETIDLACRDASRLYYLPGHPPGVKPGFRYNPGKLLRLPLTEHPSLVQDKVLLKISAKLQKSAPGITLSEWLDSKGVVYRSKPGAPEVCQLPECPWASEHASGTDGWGHAAVFPRTSDGKWSFSCCHATCKERGRGWRDFANLVAPKSSVISEEFKLGFGRRRGQA